MKQIHFSTSSYPDYERLGALLDQDGNHPHIHAVDLPYRITSVWQDLEGVIGKWESGGELLAWAVFQPPWWNLDFFLHPTAYGASLEAEIISWGREQMNLHANRTGEEFWGSFEFFADAPNAQMTRRLLEEQGFKLFDWSILRFSLDLRQDLPHPPPLDGFSIRPLRGVSEVERYVEVHRAAFDSEVMTSSWRRRILQHPDYRPEFDLVAVDSIDVPVGFCISWVRRGIGQIEPLGVMPKFQGRGLGRALEFAAIQTLRDNGIQTAVVDHGSFNEVAISLSKQTGFVQCNNAMRYYIEISPD